MQPVNAEYIEAITWLVAKFKRLPAEGNVYGNLRRTYQATYWPGDKLCSDDESPDGPRLGPAHLLGPLLVCWSLSTIGVFMFFCCGYRTHNKLCAKEMFEGHLHVQQNRRRREELNNEKFSKLYTIARDAGSIGEEDLADAVDAAPKKSKLVRLIMKNENSADGTSTSLSLSLSMEELRISELCSIAENLGMDQEEIGDCLDEMGKKENENGAKAKLISKLVYLVDTDRDGKINKEELKLALEKGSKLSKVGSQVLNSTKLGERVENPLEGVSTAPTSLTDQST